MPKKEKQGKHGKILASWDFPEFAKYNKGAGWYILAGIIGLALLYWAIVTANFLFALIIILTAVITLLHGRREPGQVSFQITEEGIEVGAKFYLWEDLKNFWIVYEPPEVKTLYIDFKSSLKPALPVPLEKENPVEIRHILLDYIEEDLTKKDESATDQIARWLKL